MAVPGIDLFVADGVEFITTPQTDSRRKFAAVFVDVAAPDTRGTGLMSPPPQFLCNDFVRDINFMEIFRPRTHCLVPLLNIAWMPTNTETHANTSDWGCTC